MEDIKKTIKDWIRRPRIVPRNYKKFFLQWILLNLYYNAKYPELKKEYKRILKLGKCDKNLFDKLMNKRNHIIKLIKNECVGNGSSISVPSSYIKTASMQLREKLEIVDGCENCRGEKKSKCEGIELTDYIYEPFEAVLIIIYQVRCNLFHGNKLILDGDQFERDKMLIKSSNSILKTVLEQIIY